MKWKIWWEFFFMCVGGVTVEKKNFMTDEKKNLFVPLDISERNKILRLWQNLRWFVHFLKKYCGYWIYAIDKIASDGWISRLWSQWTSVCPWIVRWNLKLRGKLSELQSWLVDEQNCLRFILSNSFDRKRSKLFI